LDMLPVTPERKAQLDDYARRHGKETASALDEVIANYLEWEQQDYQESVEAILKGYEDVKAGRTRPASEFLDELRAKHGFPR
jgi:predicted DNA-binding protein